MMKHMDLSRSFLDDAEKRIRSQGFMTHAMRRNLEALSAMDPQIRPKVRKLVALYHTPYVMNVFNEAQIGFH